MIDNRRFKLVQLGLLLVLVLFLVRLVDLIFFKGENYLRLATNNQFYSQKLIPHRGIIYDRHHRPLAFNLPRYALMSQPRALFSKLTPISRLDALPLLATQSGSIKKDDRRAYPVGSVLAQTVGFVRQASVEDLKRNRQISLNDLVGQAGLEKQFDRQLRGRNGRAVYEVNALGQKQRLIKKIPPIAGESLPTTLDASLSRVVAAALGQAHGAVVILDAQTGAVLSLVSQPSFDPNLLATTFFDREQEKHRQASVSAWLKDKQHPFFNRALSGTYPPGSVFKLVTALAGLEANKINPDKQVNDQGVLKVGQYSYSNWYYSQYGRTEGPISLVRAIARSNDIYFYKAAEWTGAQTMADMAHRLGLGQKTGIELHNEATGLIPNPAWKAEKTGERWFLGNTYHFGIGQGDTLVTPLQLAVLGQTLANQGQRCQPHLIADQQNYCSDTGLQQKNLDLVLQGMIEACSPGGTAYPFFQFNRQRLSHLNQDQGKGTTHEKVISQLKAGAIACKTGTAEFGKVLNQKGYRATQAWFLMLVDLTNLPLRPSLAQEKPPFPRRLVIAVLVESDRENSFKEGSRDAAPVAKKIVDWLLDQTGD